EAVAQAIVIRVGTVGIRAELLLHAVRDAVVVAVLGAGGARGPHRAGEQEDREGRQEGDTTLAVHVHERSPEQGGYHRAGAGKAAPPDAHYAECAGGSVAL